MDTKPKEHHRHIRLSEQSRATVSTWGTASSYITPARHRALSPIQIIRIWRLVSATWKNAGSFLHWTLRDPQDRVLCRAVGYNAIIRSLTIYILSEPHQTQAFVTALAQHLPTTALPPSRLSFCRALLSCLQPLAYNPLSIPPTVLHFSIYLSIYLSICLWFYRTLLDIRRFSVSWSFAHSVELLGRGTNPSQGIHRTAQTQKNSDIHASNGIRTHDTCLSGRRQFMP
jgi:hypothetical protein